MSEVTDNFQEQCAKTVEHFKQELGRIRGGRATASLIENVQVDYYGSMTPLQSLGSISVPEPRMLAVQVYDAGAVEAVEKAIQQSDLGLNPARDGSLIRVPVPALTEERRKDIVKSLGKVAEDNRISIRNHRRDANDLLKKMKESKELSEDDQKREQDVVQKITDDFIAQIDKAFAEKETEILSV